MCIHIMDDISDEAADEEIRNRRTCNYSIMTTAATGLSDEFSYLKEAVCQFIILYNVYRMTRDANGGQGYTDDDWVMTSNAMKRATNRLKQLLCLETQSHVSIADNLFIQTIRYEIVWSFCPPRMVSVLPFYEMNRGMYVSLLEKHGSKWFL